MVNLSELSAAAISANSRAKSTKPISVPSLPAQASSTKPPALSRATTLPVTDPSKDARATLSPPRLTRPASMAKGGASSYSALSSSRTGSSSYTASKSLSNSASSGSSSAAPRGAKSVSSLSSSMVNNDGRSPSSRPSSSAKAVNSSNDLKQKQQTLSKSTNLQTGSKMSVVDEDLSDMDISHDGDDDDDDMSFRAFVDREMQHQGGHSALDISAIQSPQPELPIAPITTNLAAENGNSISFVLDSESVPKLSRTYALHSNTNLNHQQPQESSSDDPPSPSSFLFAFIAANQPPISNISNNVASIIPEPSQPVASLPNPSSFSTVSLSSSTSSSLSSSSSIDLSHVPSKPLLRVPSSVSASSPVVSSSNSVGSSVGSSGLFSPVKSKPTTLARPSASVLSSNSDQQRQREHQQRAVSTASKSSSSLPSKPSSQTQLTVSTTNQSVSHPTVTPPMPHITSAPLLSPSQLLAQLTSTSSQLQISPDISTSSVHPPPIPASKHPTGKVLPRLQTDWNDSAVETRSAQAQLSASEGPISPDLQAQTAHSVRTDEPILPRAACQSGSNQPNSTETTTAILSIAAPAASRDRDDELDEKYSDHNVIQNKDNTSCNKDDESYQDEDVEAEVRGLDGISGSIIGLVPLSAREEALLQHQQQTLRQEYADQIATAERLLKEVRLLFLCE